MWQSCWQNPHIILIGGILAIIVLVICSSLSSCSAMLSGSGNVVLATSFTATDEDIRGAEADNCALEAELRERILKIQEENPDYDEYEIDTGEINHNPYELAAFLTVLYEDYTREEVQRTLREIFEAQYEYSTSHRTETVTETKQVRVGESLGQVVTSGYCNCPICCGRWSGGPTASGVYPTADHTIAVDANNPFVPMGTKVIMNGTEYTVEDTGNFDRYGVQFDVYYDDHWTATLHGHKTWEASLSEGTTTTEEKKIGTVKTDGSYLNVRSGEGLDYGVIDTLNNGDTVEVLEDHGDWLYVSIPEHTGYVCADYMDVRTVPVEVQQDGSLSISLDPELIRQMLEQAEEEGGEVTSTDLGLTPEGNLTLVDDYGNAGTTGKQFITMATKSGNIFYLIIDRDDEGNETVHFLNQVDENDLFALMDEKEVTEMKEQIAAEEAAKEAEEAAEKAKEEEATQTPAPEVEPEKEKSGANPFLLALPLLLVFGGIGGYLYLKTKRKQNSSSGQDPDAGYLDHDDDLDIYELPEEQEVKKEPVPEDDPDYWLDEEDDE